MAPGPYHFSFRCAAFFFIICILRSADIIPDDDEEEDSEDEEDAAEAEMAFEAAVALLLAGPETRNFVKPAEGGQTCCT